MRILIAAAGSRGDFQPLLALAVALRDAGHDAQLAGPSNGAPEAVAFGVPFHEVGIDVRAFLDRERRRFRRLTPWTALRVLRAAALPELDAQFERLVPLARGFDGVIGGGAQMAARSAAELAGAWYRYAVYTPQMIRSRHHPPFIVPWHLPRVLNPLAWKLAARAWGGLLGTRIDGHRQRLGLAPVGDLVEHLFSSGHALLAFDPELMPVPPDITPAHPPTGAWHLPDARPLGTGLEAFLSAGQAPLYIGFGSMPDMQPEATTDLVAESLCTLGRRAVLCAGWAGLGQRDMGPDVHVVESVNHGLLFPRCAAIIHHGGAGTTAAAARAGVAQVVVPHGFDQFNFARRVWEGGFGPAPLPRTRLSAKRLVVQASAALEDEGMQLRAAELGRALRARDSLAAAVAQISPLHA
jgi:UDP:flavonoid glycosyltransferase YjiC (YdhE family)